MTLSRRDVLTAAIVGSTLPANRGFRRAWALARPVPFLHCTDLFRPFADPDDHFDLASVFALAAGGRLDLRGILIDHPPPRHNGDPDVQAVAQLNSITGLSVPIMIGSPRPYRELVGSGTEPVDWSRELARSTGARAILTVLARSAAPVVITIAGSSRDVAIAGNANPRLMASKCAGVYLNAGSGSRDPRLARQLEYNVELDPASYAAIFSLPCPVYWLPCFEAGPSQDGKQGTAGPHGSLYSFRQQDLLPTLSDRLQNFFAFAYRQGERKRALEDSVPRASWLRTLEGPRQDAVIEAWGGFEREMWCTAGLLQAAGLAVTRAGATVPIATASDPLFSFDPVRVECDGEGVTTWNPGRSTPARFILTVRDQQRYAEAMTGALRTLLQTLK